MNSSETKTTPTASRSSPSQASSAIPSRARPVAPPAAPRRARRERHAGGGERQERGGVDEQRELRPAAGREQPAERRTEHEAGVARGLHVPVDAHERAPACHDRHERELGRLRDGVHAAEQRREHEQRRERVRERERTAERRGEQRAAGQQPAGASRSTSSPAGPASTAAGLQSAMNSAATAIPSAALLHVQRERHDREPVPERRQPDRPVSRPRSRPDAGERSPPADGAAPKSIPG